MTRKIFEEFGPVLRQFRNAKGFTQDLLGEHVGVSGAFISMLESGHNMPNLEMMFKLAKALEVRASVLVIAMEEREKKYLST